MADQHNISQMKAGHFTPRGQAMMGMNDPVLPSVMQLIRGLLHVNNTPLVEL